MSGLSQDLESTSHGETLVSGELTIEVSPARQESIVLVWRGKSTERQPARMILPYVTPRLERALHLRIPLRMQFAELEHMNSSTITAIIMIIQEARSRGMQLVIAYDPHKRWQKLAFEALRVFVKEDGLLQLDAGTP